TTVRPTGQRVDGVVVTFKQEKQTAVGEVPLSHFPEPACFASRSEQELAVGRKRERVHAATMSLERADNRAGLRCTEFDLAVAGDSEEFSGRQVSDCVDRLAGWDFGDEFRHNQ